MKIGIISDVHANYPALEAILQALEEENVEHMLSTGDVVGYGPHPEKCVAVFQEQGIPTVAGNHDRYMMNSEQQDKDVQHSSTAKSLEWTRENLSREALDWLAGLPLTLSYEGFQVVHASYVLRPPWLYVTDWESATLNMLFQKSRIAFSGHSHLPLLAEHAEGSPVHVDTLTTAYLEKDKQYLIGAGSVGQPRDRDPRACAAILDTSEMRVHLKRVDYDIKAVQEDILTAGLPPKLAQRLELGK